MINPLFLYFLITIKLFYLALIVAIIAVHSLNKNLSDIHIINLVKIKNWVQMFNELVVFTFMLYVFNPFNNTPLVIVKNEKISFFITAIIGLINVNWNLVLNRFGINIPVLDFLHF